MIALSGVLTAGCANTRMEGVATQGAGHSYGQPDSAAAAALPVLRELAKSRKAPEFGFATPEEAATATLGRPIRTTYVRLDSLRSFVVDQDAEALLVPVTELRYPVLSAREPRSIISVVERNGSWTMASMGGPELSERLFGARDSVALAQIPQDSILAIRIPALGLEFVGVRHAGELVLIPLQTAYGLTEGLALPARDVFAGLVEAARRYNGLPR